MSEIVQESQNDSKRIIRVDYRAINTIFDV